jgi:hypothetical protein
MNDDNNNNTAITKQTIVLCAIRVEPPNVIVVVCIEKSDK